MRDEPDDVPDRLLLDEMFSPLVAQILTTRGIDCIAVGSDPILKGRPDHALLQFAADQKRVIVTADIRDFELARAERRSRRLANPGAIWVSSAAFGTDRRLVGRLADALEEAARGHAASSGGGSTWLSRGIDP